MKALVSILVGPFSDPFPKGAPTSVSCTSGKTPMECPKKNPNLGEEDRGVTLRRGMVPRTSQKFLSRFRTFLNKNFYSKNL